MLVSPREFLTSEYPFFLLFFSCKVYFRDKAQNNKDSFENNYIDVSVYLQDCPLLTGHRERLQYSCVG